MRRAASRAARFILRRRQEKPAVAAIVAAYNEAETIGAVVRTLVASKLFREVIVVSDGSTDRTAKIAREHGAAVVELPFNQGKGAALAAGVARTDAPIVFFCDADLGGLTSKHVEAIVRPVILGKVAMCIGVRERAGVPAEVLSHLPLVSGQRALRRRVFEDVPEKYLNGYMVESALNYYCKSRKLAWSTVNLSGLNFRRKITKVGFWRGLSAYASMMWQVIKAMTLVRVAYTLGKF